MKNKTKKYFEKYVDAAHNAGVDRKKYTKSWNKIKSYFKQSNSNYQD